jgi:uncharacterized protein
MVQSPTEPNGMYRGGLRQQGSSIGVLIQNGIVPNDPRIAGVRFNCRAAALSPPNTPPNAGPAEPPNSNIVDIGKLSEKPTFDCNNARSLTARTMCFDRAGASADWDLITAYWARYFSLPESEREAFDKAQQDWLNSLNRSCPRAPNPPQCVLAAYHKRASGYRSQLTGEALAESRLTPEQHGKIQQSLAATGMLAGDVDGEFGSVTRSAIRQFKVQTGKPESDFLTSEERAELLQGVANPTCRVADPTSMPLNVRTKPNGPIVDTLTNGTDLRVLDRQRDERGRDWVLVTLPGKGDPLGWAFGEFIDCKPRVAGPTPPPVPPPPPAPRIETSRLKEARIFLEDAKKFIGQQTTVPSLSEIAKEAASLQLAVNQFDEHAAAESMQKLGDLLKPVPGFTEFEKEQQAERSRVEARHLTEAKALAKQNEFFIDSYLQGHLGESTTQTLLSLRQDIENSVRTNTFEKIAKANEAVSNYVKNAGLQAQYDDSARKFAQLESPPPTAPRTPKDIPTGKSKFLLEGPAGDILLLYNAPPNAPKVWKNVRGDVVFQDDTASLCFAQPSVELSVARYVEHYLGDRGARKIVFSVSPCDLGNASKTVDVIAFRRGDLLKSREDHVLGLARLLEADTFRQYETITNYDEEFRKRQILSLQIESDLENGLRKGFGAIAVTEKPVACVIPRSPTDWSDGLKELLKRNADIIAPSLTAGWESVDTPSTDLAFRGLQRQQCGYLLADAERLKTIMLALRREQIKYTFSPVWWD